MTIIDIFLIILRNDAQFVKIDMKIGENYMIRKTDVYGCTGENDFGECVQVRGNC